MRPVLGHPLAELVGVDGGAAAPRVQRLPHRGEESLARDLAARRGTLLLQEVRDRLRGRGIMSLSVLCYKMMVSLSDLAPWLSLAARRVSAT